MALQQTLKTDMPALLQGFDSAKDRQSQASFARQNLGTARQQQMAAEEEAVLGEAKMKREAVQREAGVEEQFAKDIRQTSQDFQAKRQQQAPFDASQFTLTPEQAAVDSFKTLVGGLLFGGIAKAGAGAMLEATIKMREARDKNMQNEYLTALQGYERESKRVKEFNKQLLDDMATAIDLLSTDKSAALAKAKLVEASIEDGVMKSKLRAGNWKGFVEDLQKVVNEDNKRQAEMDKLQFQRQTQMDVARLKTSEKQEKPVKVPTPLEKSLRQGNELLSRLQELKDTAKPEYFALAPADSLAAARLSAQEMGLSAIANMFGKPVNDDAVLWWKNYNDLISEERKERFGATLTGNEKQSFRETIVAPSSTIDIAINDRGTGVLDRKINLAKIGLARDFKQLSALGATQVQIDSYLPDVDTDLFKTKGSNEQRAESDDEKRRKRIEELRRKRDAGTLER